MATPGTRGEVVWWPPPDVLERTDAGRFATTHGLDGYAALHAWSVTDLDAFWRAVVDFTRVRGHDPPSPERAASRESLADPAVLDWYTARAAGACRGGHT